METEEKADPQRRWVGVEVPFTTQMLVSWPELIERAEQVARQHGAPDDARWHVIDVATPDRAGLMVWEWTDDE